MWPLDGKCLCYIKITKKSTTPPSESDPFSTKPWKHCHQSHWSHTQHLGLARTPDEMNKGNILRQRLLTLHLTWETCGNLWHASTHMHKHMIAPSLFCYFFFPLAWGEISAWRYWEPDNSMHRGMHKHPHRGRSWSRTQPWKSSDPPGENFTEWPCLQEQNNLSVPSILPSIQGKERVRPWFMSHKLSGPMFSLPRWIFCITFYYWFKLFHHNQQKLLLQQEGYGLMLFTRWSIKGMVSIIYMNDYLYLGW